MKPIQFNTVVGMDQVIRPPAGVVLPEGEVQVVVMPRAEERTINGLASTRSWLLALAEDAELAKPDLPTDMAMNHDHYAHGKPLP